MLGVFISDGSDSFGREVIDDGMGIRHDDGGMRGDDELRASLDQLVQADEERQLALRRKSRLRLVEEVEAVPAQPRGEERQEGFAVGLLMEGDIAIPDMAHVIDVAAQVVKTFRPQEEAVAAGQRPPRPGELQFAGEVVTVRVPRLEHRMPRAPLGIEPQSVPVHAFVGIELDCPLRQARRLSAISQFRVGRCGQTPGKIIDGPGGLRCCAGLKFDDSFVV